MSRTQGRVNRTQGRGRKMQKRFFGDGTLTLREAEGAWRMLRKLPLSDCCSDLVLNGALWRCGNAELAQDQDQAYGNAGKDGKDGKEGRVRVVRRCKWRDWPHFIFREAQP